jgi:hypothetical protein
METKTGSGESLRLKFTAIALGSSLATIVIFIFSYWFSGIHTIGYCNAVVGKVNGENTRLHVCSGYAPSSYIVHDRTLYALGGPRNIEFAFVGNTDVGPFVWMGRLYWKYVGDQEHRITGEGLGDEFQWDAKANRRDDSLYFIGVKGDRYEVPRDFPAYEKNF